MEQIRIITPEIIKTYKNDIALNFRADRFLTPIWEGQEKRLPELLGEDFYDDLIAKYTLNQSEPSTDLPANYISLYPYLEPFLAIAAYIEYLPISNHTDTSFGTVHKDTQYSTRETPKELDAIIKSNENMLMRYGRKILKFLRANKENYPLFEKPCSDERRIRISRTVSLSSEEYDY